MNFIGQVLCPEKPLNHAHDLDAANGSDDEEYARCQAIKYAFEQVKTSQSYTEEDVQSRHVYGLRILRTAQLAKGAKTKVRFLKTLLATPSTQSLPGYRSSLKVSEDQVVRMLFMLCIIHELNRMNENIMLRSLKIPSLFIHDLLQGGGQD